MFNPFPSILRFLVGVMIVATMVSCAGRVFSDFGEPAENDPHNLIRGIGVWVVAVLIAGFSELLLRRRSRRENC
jgi:hypothetical protein